MLVAHNARFDLAFLDREVERLTSLRLANPVVDTVWLARRLLAGRTSRCSLAALSQFFGTATRPCHRALPDAEATGEILLQLIGLAQERGARTVADLADLATPQTRRVHAKRRLVREAPQRPGVYFFRDERGNVLYVGKARDLRARLRSYFGTGRQRPSVEAALAAVEESSGACSAPSSRPRSRSSASSASSARRRTRAGSGRSSTCAGAAPGWVVSREAGRPRPAHEPDARPRSPPGALDGFDAPRGRAARSCGAASATTSTRCATRTPRGSATASPRSRRSPRALRQLERLRALETWLVVPAVEEGFRRAFLVSGGRIAAERTLPPGAGERLELDAGLAEARLHAGGQDADELLLIGSFLRRPPPELEVMPAEVRKGGLKSSTRWRRRRRSPSRTSPTGSRRPSSASAASSSSGSTPGSS